MKPVREVNYYDLLGVEKNATREQIRKSHKAAVKLFHPDLLESNKEIDPLEKEIRKAIISQINSAYDVLSNETTRAEYDKKLTKTAKSSLEYYLEDDCLLKTIDYCKEHGIVMDKYEFIGLGNKKNATNSEIVRAFLPLATAYNTTLLGNTRNKDVASLINIEKIYNELKETLGILLNKQTRAEYDDILRNSLGDVAKSEKILQRYKENAKILTPKYYTNVTSENYQTPKYTSSSKEKSQKTSKKPKKAQPKVKVEEEKGDNTLRYSTKKSRSLKQTLKDGWREVREDEKSETLKDRIKKANRQLRKIYPKNSSSIKNIAYYISSPIYQITHEIAFQLSKVRFITEDNFFKFGIRMRALLATALIAFTAPKVAKVITEKQVFTKEQSAIETLLDDNLNDQNTPDDLEFEDTNQITVVTGKTTEEKEEEKEKQEITLNRVHRVAEGERLEQYSLDSNTTINYIKQVNNMTSEQIYTGTNIIIPYVIDADDLSYYTTTKQYSTGMSLKAFASQCETDIETLVLLNPEAIEKRVQPYGDPKYVVIADSLVIPDFITKTELLENKQASADYVKTLNN